MKQDKTSKNLTVKEAIQTVARAARKKSFRKGQPVAISKNGQVFFVYSDNREVLISPANDEQ